jgi:VRR-NUC domain-containing protein
MSDGQGAERPRPGRQKPEIRISLRGVRRLATGETKKGDRIVYPLPDGRLVTSERLVLTRARKAGYGCFRLRPYLWRLLPHLAPAGTDWGTLPPSLDGDDVLVAMLRNRPHLIEVLSTLPTGRLKRLARRHAGRDVDPKRPGVPDLLVYKKSPKGPHAFRFVEVKRPHERLLAHQGAEIAFMRHLGMRAGVLRLVEAVAPV